MNPAELLRAGGVGIVFFYLLARALGLTPREPTDRSDCAAGEIAGASAISRIETISQALSRKDGLQLTRRRRMLRRNIFAIGARNCRSTISPLKL
jgi:hypothetical protein